MSLMTTTKLILLRIYTVTLGRFSFFSKALKMALVFCLIKKSHRKYFATSNYFDWKDIEPQ